MYKIGYISGMFDILHIGHVNLLRQSKELCEYLIVAVGTDDFMRCKKNREPVIPYIERVEIIKSIRYVDQVVAGKDLDRLSAYYQYGFNVIFAGDDHKDNPVYIHYSNKLKEIGVDTIYFPHTYKTSSTSIRNSIISNYHC